MKRWHCIVIAGVLEAAAGAVMMWGYHIKAQENESAAWTRAIKDVEKAKAESADGV